MQYDYDLFVIGAGSAGVRAARMAAQEGIKVGIAEQRFLGGTCVNVGCVPKKLFFYASHFAEEFHASRGFGWQTNKPDFDWRELVENKNKEIARLNDIYKKLLENSGCDLYAGRAILADNHTILINDQEITAEKIIIATGCTPNIPEFEGSEYAVSSDDIFFLKQLPKKVLVVGGGYIAVEFAGIFNGLNVETTLSYRGKQLLKHFDSDLGSHLQIEMQRQGINLLLESNVKSIKPATSTDQEKKSYLVEFTDNNQQDYDLILYATGRKPLTNNLGLENTIVQLNEKGQINVDEYFQTSEPSIFAMGDIIGTPELTPVALAQGMAFVDTWVKGNRRTVDYNNIPTAVFSHPNIATVGFTETEAKKQFNQIKIFESDFKALKNTLSGNEERTYMKLIVDSNSDKVLGAHMIGPDAGELVQGIAIAIKAGATKAIFDSTIGIHPTSAEEFVTMRTSVR